MYIFAKLTLEKVMTAASKWHTDKVIIVEKNVLPT